MKNRERDLGTLSPNDEYFATSYEAIANGYSLFVRRWPVSMAVAWGGRRQSVG